MERASNDAEAKRPDVVQRLRTLRASRGLSQHELAAASGLSRNTVSLIERGRSSPTLGTLQKIAVALHVDVEALVGAATVATTGATGARPTHTVSLQRPAEGGYSVDGLISAVVLRLDPNARCGSLLPHSGETFVYCLSGRCLLVVDQRRHLLEAGDSLLFAGSLPHSCANPGSETARALVIFLDLAA